MSGGDYSAAEFAKDLLFGLGGEPCRNRDAESDSGSDGVWLPASSWMHMCQLAGFSDVSTSIARTGRERAQLLDAYEQTERHAACTDIASNPLRCVR